MKGIADMAKPGNLVQNNFKLLFCQPVLVMFQDFRRGKHSNAMGTPEATPTTDQLCTLKAHKYINWNRDNVALGVCLYIHYHL